MVEVLFAAYVIWAALTMVQAVEAKEALKAWKQIVVHFAAFLAGLRLLGDRGARPLVRVIALFGIVIGLQLVATVLAHGFSLSHLAMRVPSMTDLGWGFSVYVAAVAALTAAASIALSLYGRSWERMLGVAGLAAAVLVSNATLSRGGTLAIAVGLLVTAALELRRRFLLVVAIVGVPLATYLFSSLGQATLERFVRPQALPSVAARLVFYQEGFTIAKAHPLFGVGPGQLPYNTHLYIGPNPHNFLLKNAIDHASRPYGQNAWAEKPAGVLGVSIGATGTCMAQQHLRNILACLDVPVMGQPEAFIQAKEGLFDPAGDIGQDSKEFLRGWMDRYIVWVKRYSV